MAICASLDVKVCCLRQLDHSAEAHKLEFSGYEDSSINCRKADEAIQRIPQPVFHVLHLTFQAFHLLRIASARPGYLQRGEELVM